MIIVWIVVILLCLLIGFVVGFYYAVQEMRNNKDFMKQLFECRNEQDKENK